MTQPSMRHTHNRSQRFGGHTKHTFYCSCGRQVSGNGGKQHFKVEGHRRIAHRLWWEQFGSDSNQDRAPVEVDPASEPEAS